MNKLDLLQAYKDVMSDTQQKESKVLCDQCGEYITKGNNYYEMYNEVFCESCKDFFIEEVREVVE